jgi:hypothetical protein
VGQSSGGGTKLVLAIQSVQYLFQDLVAAKFHWRCYDLIGLSATEQTGNESDLIETVLYKK